MPLEEVAVTGAQAGIRRLYEQVRVLEAEAARPTRRRHLPRALVIVAAVAIGAATAGVSHEAARQTASRHEALRAAPHVAHLIDEPAERRRALPHLEHVVRRAHVRVAHVAARITTPVVQVAPRVATPVVHAAPVRSAVSPAVSVVRHSEPVRPAAAPVAPRPSAVPVGVGPVVVTTTDELDPAGPPAATAP